MTTAYMLLVLALLASALSFVAPFWILFPGASIESAQLANMYRTSVSSIFDIATWKLWAAGLWGACKREGDIPECGWFFQNDFYAEKNLPGWWFKISSHKAVASNHCYS